MQEPTTGKRWESRYFVVMAWQELRALVILKSREGMRKWRCPILRTLASHSSSVEVTSVIQTL